MRTVSHQQWIFQTCGSIATELFMLLFTQYKTIWGLPLSAVTFQLYCLPRCLCSSHMKDSHSVISNKTRLYTKKTYSYNKNPESLCYEQRHMSVLILIETIIGYWFNDSSSSTFSSAAQTLTFGWPFLLLKRFFTTLVTYLVDDISHLLQDYVRYYTRKLCAMLKCSGIQIPAKIQSQCLFPVIEICFLICRHRET